MRRALLGLGIVLAIGIAGLAWSLAGLWRPADLGGAPQVFRVEPGEVLGSVARRLEVAGLLPERPGFGPRVLVGFARIMGLDRHLKSGEYDLSPRMTPLEILDVLVSGRVKTYPVTLPPGLRLEEIATRLEAAGIVAHDALLAHATDPTFVASLGLEAPTLEGYLYPETYRFRRRSAPAEVLQRMLEEFQARWTEADRVAARRSGMSERELITLASIVEKETAAPEERALIAAVFHNRLRRGMRLQSDPTVIYGLWHARGTFDGNLRRRDLERDTPYNTYTRGGLPPGPIASVSMASVRAVLSPADVPYLYFVSRNDGTHEFSRTLREHSEAVERYQRGGRRGS